MPSMASIHCDRNPIEDRRVSDQTPFGHSAQCRRVPVERIPVTKCEMGMCTFAKVALSSSCRSNTMKPRHIETHVMGRNEKALRGQGVRYRAGKKAFLSSSREKHRRAAKHHTEIIGNISDGEAVS